MYNEKNSYGERVFLRQYKYFLSSVMIFTPNLWKLNLSVSERQTPTFCLSEHIREPKRHFFFQFRDKISDVPCSRNISFEPIKFCYCFNSNYSCLARLFFVWIYILKEQQWQFANIWFIFHSAQLNWLMDGRNKQMSV